MKGVALTLAGAAFVLAAFASGMVWADLVVNDRPMPCGEEAAYVWDHYPTEAHCVDGEDL